MNKLKDHILLGLIILLFLYIYFLHLDTNADLWWDSSVYIGMGKYIYSSGELGLYEASRPLIWPLILGFFWKLGLDVIFFGKLLNIKIPRVKEPNATGFGMETPDRLPGHQGIYRWR